MIIKTKEIDTRFRLIFGVQEDGVCLRNFLNDKDISKRTLTAIKYGGGRLAVNGIERDVRYSLRFGDQVEVIFPPEEMSDGLTAEDGPLDVIFEDEAMIILNKPPNQSTIPSRNHRSGTVANFIGGKFIREGINATVHIVTRLDHNTSGLICIAKNRHIHHLLSKQLIQARFHREYEAIVEGHVTDENFTINEPIGRKDNSIIERVICEDGKSARTDVHVKNRFMHQGQKFSQITLVLHTGRTHQIRVHVQCTGHPLAGDDLYGGSQDLIARQALHCALLEFNHPLTGERQSFKSAIPADMKKLLT